MKYKHLDKLGVLLTSHPRQQMFMKDALVSWRGYPYHIEIGYDDEYPNFPIEHLHNYLPEKHDYFYTNRKAGELGHFRGELIQMQIGGKILEEKGYEYIFKSAADTTCYKWRNLDKLFDLLLGKHHYDIILCGTAVLLAKTKVFNACLADYNEHTKCGGAELFFNSQIRKHGFKDCRKKADFWETLLGRIHVQGEYALNTQTNIIETWKVGQLWGKTNPHRDIVR